MPPVRARPRWTDLDSAAAREPGPRYGHLADKHPEYAAVEEALRVGFGAMWELPDWPAARAATHHDADPDAPLPPGPGPGPTSSGPTPAAAPDHPSREHIVTRKLHFPARDGHPVELKVYRHRRVLPGAALMYRMHGGGWVVGRHEVDGAENVYAAMHRNVVVVSVDYRNPEHPFPTPFFDSYDGLLWCKANAHALGVDPERIILAGSSAGGNLAAALAIEARAAGVTGVLAQVLHFPATCHPAFQSQNPGQSEAHAAALAPYELRSHAQNARGAVLGCARHEAFCEAYAGDPRPDPRHSPLLAPPGALRGLPPALIQCAGLDVMRDEALAYGEALARAQASGGGGGETDNDDDDDDPRATTTTRDGDEVYAYRGLPHCFPGYMLGLAETALFYARYDAFIDRVVGVVRAAEDCS